jgi:hypothetical protein
MSRKVLFAILLALGSYTYAEETQPVAEAGTNTNQVVEVSKDVWLNAMLPAIPEMICKGFIEDVELKKRFDELKMTFEDCTKAIPESVTKCKNEIYPGIPAQVNEQSAAEWGRKLGECIGRDFAEKHLVP